MKEKIRQTLFNFAIWLLWKTSEDITYTYRYMHELYNDVPENLKNICVQHWYINEYSKCENKDEILKWLDNEFEK